MPEVVLPTLHPGQAAIFRARAKFNAVRCGRRWGKTKLLVTIAADAAAKGMRAGIFAPEHRQLQEPFAELLQILAPIRERSSKTDGTIRTTTGGACDFWSLIDNELAGRGREYDRILIDEASYTKDVQMQSIWNNSIKPTTLTRPSYSVWLFATPNGIRPDNFFFAACRGEKTQFKEHYAPSSSNPLVPAAEIEEHRRNDPPLTFQQEYLAEFVDWSGNVIFPQTLLLVEGKPVAVPDRCDTVFATIDTAVKGGGRHDGTAVVFAAYNSLTKPCTVILDWGTQQVDGALLEEWLPSVFAKLEEFAKQCGARYGSSGVLIEDAAAGSVLIQQSRRRGWPVRAIDSKLTSLGKDVRASTVSPYVFRGDVKISEPAYDKKTSYKGRTANHFVSQVCGFRIGEHEINAEDDLLDCFCYLVAATCGRAAGTGKMM